MGARNSRYVDKASTASRFDIQSLNHHHTEQAPLTKSWAPRFEIQRAHERPRKLQFEAELGQKYVELKDKYEDALSFLRQIGAADLKTADILSMSTEPQL